VDRKERSATSKRRLVESYEREASAERDNARDAQDEVEYANVEDLPPLASADFVKALREVDKLGLTWTGDFYPDVRPKSSKYESALDTEGFAQIGSEYPQLPREVGYVVLHLLTGASADVVGDEEALRAKSEAVKELLLTPSYRSEFFFNHLLKIPRLTDLVWEVVIKTSDQSIKEMAPTTYAVISLQVASSTNDEEKSETLSFAVDELRAVQMIEMLSDVQVQIKRAEELAEKLQTQ
jgi:hypothetical protein